MTDFINNPQNEENKVVHRETYDGIETMRVVKVERSLFCTVTVPPRVKLSNISTLPPKDISERLSQPKNKSPSSSSVRCFGIAMRTSEEQPTKASSPRDAVPTGRMSEEREEQPKKARLPIFLNLTGISTTFKERQPSKVESSISVILSESFTASSETQE